MYLQNISFPIRVCLGKCVHYPYRNWGIYLNLISFEGGCFARSRSSIRIWKHPDVSREGAPIESMKDNLSLEMGRYKLH